MLISTCNNAGRINSELFNNRLIDNGKVVMDEAAFAQGYDVSVLMSLPHKYGYKVGHHQQLEPIVGSRDV